MSNIIKIEQKRYSIAELEAMAMIAVDSKKYGPEYNKSTILNIYLTAQAVGIHPMIALNGGFHVIKGKISMNAHMMVAKVREGGHSMKVIELTKDKCVIIGVRKDNGDSIKFEYTYEDAQAANLTGKDNWKTDRKNSLYCACARKVCRMLFSDLLGIAYDREEIDTIPDHAPTINTEISSEPLMIPETLSEKQIAELDSYLEEDQEAAKIITDRLEIETVYDMKPEKHETVIKFLQTRKENRANESTRVA